MSVNYSTLFTNVGKCIKYVNTKETLETTTLPAEVQAIAAAVGTAATTFGEAQLPLEGLDFAYQNYGQAITNIRQSISNFVTAMLTDEDTVVSQIPNLIGNDISIVLPAIQQDMQDNAQTVNASVATLGSITALSANIGNGTVLLDKILDGTTQPGLNFPASLTYLNRPSELVVPSETMQLTCTADSNSGNTQEGAEQFSWNGAPPFVPFDYHNDGSGNGPSLTVSNGSNIISNLGFNQWSGGKPAGYTVASGTTGVGGTIQQDTTAANVYRGTSALKFTGNGALSQAVSLGQIQPRTRYCLTIRLKASTGSTGQVQFFWSGTGYTAGSESIIVAASSLSTSYTLYSAYWTTPATIPTNLTFNVVATGGVSGAIWVDSGSFDQNVYHGGVNARIIAGNTPFSLNDRFRFPITNTEGVFQKFFRRWYGVMLPSALNMGNTPYYLLPPYTLFTGASVGSTISDSLAS